MTFSGDATFDSSHIHVSVSRHRSRQLRQQRRNIVSFDLSNNLGVSSESDSDFDDGPAIVKQPQASFSAASDVSIQGEDLLIQVDGMSRELDGLIRFFRKGVEGLAGGISDVASAFRVLSFALEDWDR